MGADAKACGNASTTVNKTGNTIEALILIIDRGVGSAPTERYTSILHWSCSSPLVVHGLARSSSTEDRPKQVVNGPHPRRLYSAEWHDDVSIFRPPFFRGNLLKPGDGT